MKSSVIETLAEELHQEHRESTRDRLANHPSELPYCTRKIVYNRLGYDKRKPDAHSLLIFEIGHKIHDMVQSKLLAAGMIADRSDIEVEVRDEELNITGSADGILTIDDERVLLEIKSISQKAFLKLTKPKDEHVLQTQLYMHLLGLESTRILYVCKDYDQANYKNFDLQSLPMKEFTVEYSPETVEFLLQKIWTINTCVAKGELPPREYSVSKGWADFPCRYCDYVYHCQEAYPAFEEYNREKQAKANMTKAQKKKEYTDNTGLGSGGLF